MVLDVDLNSPPVPEGGSASFDSWLTENGALAANNMLASAESSKGLACSPIDVEAIDDDVELLYSTTALPQGRNFSIRNLPVVDLEGTEEIPPGLSGSIEKETVDTLLSLNNINDGGGSSINRISVDRRQYVDLEWNDNAKRLRSSLPGLSNLPPLPPKEPTFSCPVCMSSLTDPCSTICGHIFCQGCIEAAIKAKKQCPNCRRKLASKKSFHRVYLPKPSED